MAVRRSRVLLVVSLVGALDVDASLDIPSDVGGILKGGFLGCKKLVNASMAEVSDALRRHKQRITGAAERISQGVRQTASQVGECASASTDEAAEALPMERGR